MSFVTPDFKSFTPHPISDLKKKKIKDEPSPWPLAIRRTLLQSMNDHHDECLGKAPRCLETVSVNTLHIYCGACFLQ